MSRYLSMSKLRYYTSKVLLTTTAFSLALILCGCKDRIERQNTIAKTLKAPDASVDSMGKEEGKLGVVPKRTDDFAPPKPIKEMTDEEFSVYTRKLKNAGKPIPSAAIIRLLNDIGKGLEALPKDPKYIEISAKLSEFRKKIEETPATDKKSLNQIMVDLRRYYEQLENGSKSDKRMLKLIGREQIHVLSRKIIDKVGAGESQKSALKN